MSHPHNYKLTLWCDHIFLKKLVMAFDYIIPFKIGAVHIFESSQSVVSEVVFPIIKHDMFIRNTVPSGIGYNFRKPKKVNFIMTLSLLTSLI